jgi:predicted TIM-barrel fold metal-dependent hydrolase
MTSAPLVDVHVHVLPSETDPIRDGYEIWEYGPRDDVVFCDARGTVHDVDEAVREAGFAHVVAVNLFVADLVREEALSALRQDEPAQAAAAIEESMPDRLRAFNRWICDVARDRPWMTPFVAADPHVLGGEAGAAHLREMAEGHGARGIKIHPAAQRFRPDDPGMAPIYRECRELGLAVLSHSGASQGRIEWAEPAAFASVLRDHPGLTLVLAHLGGGRWGQTVELAASFPQATFDLCEVIEWTGAPNAPADEQLAALIREVGVHRVMMGSDYPWYDLGHTVERVMALPGFSDEEREGILGGNAARILGLPVDTGPSGRR